jgi:hypothetical protein
MWHPKIALNSLIAFIEFLSMNIFYWAVAHLLYREGGNSFNLTFYQQSSTVAIFFICIISIYIIFRLFFNALGGIYMLKRCLIAAILAPAYQDLSYIAPLVILECVFVIVRYQYEKPNKQK